MIIVVLQTDTYYNLYIIIYNVKWPCALTMTPQSIDTVSVLSYMYSFADSFQG